MVFAPPAGRMVHTDSQRRTVLDTRRASLLIGDAVPGSCDLEADPDGQIPRVNGLLARMGRFLQGSVNLVRISRVYWAFRKSTPGEEAEFAGHDFFPQHTYKVCR